MDPLQQISGIPARTDTIGRVVDAAAKVTGKRFCAHHQGEVFTSNGCYVKKGRMTRFICFNCQELRKRK